MSLRVSVKGLLLAVVLSGCGPTAIEVCEQQCDKLVVCANLDRQSCYDRCALVVTPATAECRNADLDLRKCELTLSCEDYSVNAGCAPQRSAYAANCSK